MSLARRHSQLLSKINRLRAARDRQPSAVNFGYFLSGLMTLIYAAGGLSLSLAAGEKLAGAPDSQKGAEMAAHMAGMLPWAEGLFFIFGFFLIGRFFYPALRPAPSAQRRAEMSAEIERLEGELEMARSQMESGQV